MVVSVGDLTEPAKVQSVMAGAVSADVVGLENFMISGSLASYVSNLLQLITDLELQIHYQSLKSNRKFKVLQINTDRMLISI
jgi:hypothetical protein